MHRPIVVSSYVPTGKPSISYQSWLLLGSVFSEESKDHLVMPSYLYSSWPKSVQRVPPSGILSSDYLGTPIYEGALQLLSIPSL